MRSSCARRAGRAAVACGRREHGGRGAHALAGRATFDVRLVAAIDGEASGKTRPFVALGARASHETIAPAVEPTWQSPTQEQERGRQT